MAIKKADHFPLLCPIIQAVFYGVPPTAPKCSVVMDRMAPNEQFGTGIVKCQPPKDTSGLTVKQYNIYLRPLDTNQTGNSVTLRLGPTDPLLAKLLGGGWKLPNLEAKRPYEVNVTAETYLGEGLPFVTRLAATPEGGAVPAIIGPQPGDVTEGSAKTQGGNDHKKTVGVAVGTTLGVIGLLLILGFMGARLLKGTKFLSGKKYHDLDGNGTKTPTNAGAAPAPTLARPPGQVEMTTV